jgi:hypothetical protein
MPQRAARDGAQVSSPSFPQCLLLAQVSGRIGLRAFKALLFLAGTSRQDGKQLERRRSIGLKLLLFWGRVVDTGGYVNRRDTFSKPERSPSALVNKLSKQRRQNAAVFKGMLGPPGYGGRLNAVALPTANTDRISAQGEAGPFGRIAFQASQE